MPFRFLEPDLLFNLNRRRPQVLGMKTPAEAYALAACPGQEVLGHYTYASQSR